MIKRKSWKSFPGCFVFECRVSTKTVVIVTYIKTILELRILFVCPSVGQMVVKCREISLRFQGPKLFNSLSTEIQNASSIAVFAASKL